MLKRADVKLYDYFGADWYGPTIRGFFNKIQVITYGIYLRPSDTISSQVHQHGCSRFQYFNAGDRSINARHVDVHTTNNGRRIAAVHHWEDFCQ